MQWLGEPRACRAGLCLTHTLTPGLPGLCDRGSWSCAGSPNKPLSVFGGKAPKFSLQYAAFTGYTIVLTDVVFYLNAITLIRKEIR